MLFAWQKGGECLPEMRAERTAMGCALGAACCWDGAGRVGGGMWGSSGGPDVPNSGVESHLDLLELRERFSGKDGTGCWDVNFVSWTEVTFRKLIKIYKPEWSVPGGNGTNDAGAFHLN